MSAYRELPEQEIIQLYQEGTSLRELSKKYNIDKGVIKKRLIKHGIELRSLSEANRIYSVDEDIFAKINSHEKAYWLGFLASDGVISGNVVRIGLSFKDYGHLEEFRKFMKSEHPIHTYYPVVKGKQYKSCEIAITSSKLAQDLAKLNIVGAKSKILQPSAIPVKYVSSYLLGVVDGDGSFSVDKKGQLHLNIISSLPMCEFIMNTLVKKCKITPTKIIPEKRSDGMYYCYFGGNKKIKRIADFLYHDAYCFLQRKHKVANDHLQRLI